MALTKVKLISDGVIVQGNLHSSHGITTAHIGEGSNLYYTDARVDTRVGNLNTGNLPEGSNLYYTDARADARIAAASTSDLSEGTNLYYTDARADARVALIVDSSPATLNTLNELAAALGDDPNFATTTAASIGLKAPLASPTFTGIPVLSNRMKTQDGSAQMNIGQWDGVNHRIEADANRPLKIYSYNTSSGIALGISGSDKLTINGNGSGITVAGAGNFSGSVTVADDIITTGSSKSVKYFRRWYMDANNDFGINNNAGTSTLFYMNSSGNVGIGVTDPDYTLHLLKSSGDTEMYINGQNGQSSLRMGLDARNWQIKTAAAPYLWSLNYVGTDVPLSNIITANVGGNVGIGTDSPSSILQIKKATLPRIALTKTGILDWFIGNPSQGTSNNFTIGTNSGSNTEILTITNTANVGIGTDSPVKKLQVSDSATGLMTNLLLTNTHDTNGDTTGIAFSMTDNDLYNKAGIVFERLTTQGRGSLHFCNNNTNGSANFTLADAAMTVEYTGEVGIGETTPATKLHVKHTTAINDAYGLVLVENTSTGSGGGVNSAVNVKNYYGTSQFMQWENYGLRIGSRVLANGGTGDIIFTAGSDQEKMRLRAGGGITFNGDTVSANALDDYEEGTWTPAVSGSTTAGTATYGSQGGSYTKIGNKVTCWFSITNFTQSGAAGNFTITGLPFTCITTSTVRGCFSSNLRFYNMPFPGDLPTISLGDNSTSFIILWSRNNTSWISQSIVNTGNQYIEGYVTYSTA